jgi:hypothetical protein
MLFVRLAETITWCNSLESVAQVRSPDLRPGIFHEGRDDAVCEVGRSRAFWYQRQKLEAADQMPDFKGGELMVYFPDQNLSDGYAELVSKGFFDVENVPPLRHMGCLFRRWSRDNGSKLSTLPSVFRTSTLN